MRLKLVTSVFGRELPRYLRAFLRREPPIHEAALAFVREHAKAGDPAAVLAALDTFAREDRFLMNVGEEKGPLLEAEVRKAGPAARVLELGTFVGYSAVAIARNLGPEGRLVSVDSDPKAAATGRGVADHAGLGGRVEFLTGKGGEVLAGLEAEPFDLVFLDHWKTAYKPDLELVLERGLLKPGGVVFADNLGELFGDNPYIAWMKAHPDFESEWIASHVEYRDLEDAVMISRHRG